MATIGQQLLTPEAGWMRIDDKSPSFKYGSGWTVSGADPLAWANGYIYNSTTTSPMEFSFIGTKIRIITGTSASGTTAAKIDIDGVIETFSVQAAGIYNYLAYEKTGLSNQKHSVKIWRDANYLWIDAIDIDSDGALAGAAIRQSLTAPEAGWRRYDDNHETLSYTDFEQLNLTTSGAYRGAASFAKGGISTERVRFDFLGSRLRIISAITRMERSPSITINIDGVAEVFTARTSTIVNQTVVYEKTGLSNTRHSVEIRNFNSPTASWSAFGLDAIDIDANGRLLHYDEVIDPKDLVIGKRIRCNYKASSGVVGTFSGLGQETKDFIPVASSATPDGDFYLIMVDDWNGKKRILADRNIQNSISWDTLNAAGISSGSGLEFTEIMNLGYFSQVAIIDPVGGDDSNSGSKDSPWKTVNKAVNSVGVSGVVVLKSGVHTINTSTGSLHDLCTTKGLTFVGEGLSTILEVKNTPVAIVQTAGTSAYFYNMVIRPSNDHAGDARMIWYSNYTARDNFKLRFNNVAFTKSMNGSYPTLACFSYSNNANANADSVFENCSFIGINPEGDNLLNGLRYKRCAFSVASGIIPASKEDCAFNVTYDSSLHVVSGGLSEIAVGVYGGKLTWDSFTPELSKNNRLTVGLLTGGVTITDKDNEWDRYVVNSTFGGAITAGDNSVWNWSLISWTSTTGAAAGNRVRRGGAAVGTWEGATASSSATTATGFRPMLIVESSIYSKFLFKDGSNLKVYSGTAWNIIGTTPATKSIFNNYGMDSLSLITINALQELGEINLQYWIVDDNNVKNLNVIAIPKPVVIKATNDLTINNVINIDSFTITTNLSGSGVIKTVVSNDSGHNWKSHNGTNWINVDIDDLDDVKNNGMDSSQINSLASIFWNELLGSGKIRFAYYIEITSISDKAETDALLAQFDMQGIWRKAPSSDYIYEYPSNSKLRVTFLSNGGYKINYVDLVN